MCVIGVVGALGFSSDSRAAALVRRGLFASRHMVVTISTVVGATRAPRSSARIRAFAKRGQMTGGPGTRSIKNLSWGPA
jgi:hypothetical protein